MTLIKDTCAIAAEIVEGKRDAELGWIIQACSARQKRLFRKDASVILRGTKNVELDGQKGTVIKANQKTISVDMGHLGEYNVPVSMLEPATVT